MSVKVDRPNANNTPLGIGCRRQKMMRKKLRHMYAIDTLTEPSLRPGKKHGTVVLSYTIKVFEQEYTDLVFPDAYRWLQTTILRNVAESIRRGDIAGFGKPEAVWKTLPEHLRDQCEKIMDDYAALWLMTQSMMTETSKEALVLWWKELDGEPSDSSKFAREALEKIFPHEAGYVKPYPRTRVANAAWNTIVAPAERQIMLRRIADVKYEPFVGRERVCEVERRVEDYTKPGMARHYHISLFNLITQDLPNDRETAESGIARIEAMLNSFDEGKKN